tara:strand:+ start:453 stop:962 length:510 start_codon:yes stop_codon:yes gene_type:complete
MKILETDMLLIKSDILNEIADDIMSKMQIVEEKKGSAATRSKILQDSLEVSRQAVSMAAERFISENEDSAPIISSYGSHILRIVEEELLSSRKSEISLSAKQDTMRSIAEDLKNNARECSERLASIKRVIDSNIDLSKSRDSIGKRPEKLSTRRAAHSHVAENKKLDSE